MTLTKSSSVAPFIGRFLITQLTIKTVVLSFVIERFDMIFESVSLLLLKRWIIYAYIDVPYICVMDMQE